MNKRWYSFLVLGLILLLVTSNIGCPTGFSQEDMDAARATSYADGYSSGETKGYGVGITDGYADGYNVGEADGFNAGRIEGYSDGYDVGKIEGQSEGYNEGYSAGWWTSYYETYGYSLADFSIEITYLTSPIGPGYYATISAKTLPHASCDITITYASGPGDPKGLFPKRADILVLLLLSKSKWSRQ